MQGPHTERATAVSKLPRGTTNRNVTSSALIGPWEVIHDGFLRPFSADGYVQPCAGHGREMEGLDPLGGYIYRVSFPFLFWGRLDLGIWRLRQLYLPTLHV
jgi:hypothetical protein